MTLWRPWNERNPPSRNYRVRWKGVRYSPRADRFDFYAGADDGVILRSAIIVTSDHGTALRASEQLTDIAPAA